MLDSTLDIDLQETGFKVLRLTNAIQRAEKVLTRLASDKDIDMFARAEAREALLILREAME
jgi:hypothetical protein